MEGQLPLDARKQQILKAVVSDYTRTGVPVGSQALAGHLAAWSSATIRNELATLVHIGYLLQPHTSAGRVPSDLGYRYYVDFLMEEEDIPQSVRRQMDPFFGAVAINLEEVLETAASALAVVTDAVSIVTGPRALEARVKHLDLVSLDADNALLVLVLEGNLVRQQTLRLTQASEQLALSAVAAALNTTLVGLDVDAVAALPAPEGAHAALEAEVTSLIVAFMRAMRQQQDALVVHDGVRNLLHQPEFEDIETLQSVLEIVEEERVLAELIAAIDPAADVRVMIGRETGLDQLSRCSLVLTTYRAGGGRGGTIGVLGPTRMRYDQVGPRVRYVAQRVGRMLNRVLS
ncbi:MAG TPA: heat-inducible transcriptional repressor HrcA [Candidatus Dormibacteraeota bacterium]|nr:heat-inducible transcriptional repressor HrcA [Candidatus Dormibacteraeota bacterium]